jgi:hypothetical protein
MLNRRLTGTAALLALTSCLLALGAACSTQKSEADQDSGVPDASFDTLVTTGPIWTADSRVIDVSCFSFFEGSVRIRANRDQLTADQLTILSGMTLIPPLAQCYEDTNACTVAISAADGTVATYTTEATDSGCGSAKPVIQYASFDRFLHSVPCLAAKQAVYETADGGINIPPLVPDVRCYNGVFAAPPNPVQRLLVVDDPSILRHVELDSCNDTRRSPATAHPQLLTPDGTTPLPVVWVAVTTDPGADGTCYRADYTFPAAGAYVLRIDLDTGFTAGDFFVRFY